MVSDQIAIEWFTDAFQLAVPGKSRVLALMNCRRLRRGSLRNSFARRPGYLNFDATNYSWKPGVDYRKHPELYRVGKGKQGVLICEPYKTEIGKHSRFRTKGIAEESSKLIFSCILLK